MRVFLGLPGVVVGNFVFQVFFFFLMLKHYMFSQQLTVKQIHPDNH